MGKNKKNNKNNKNKYELANIIKEDINNYYNDVNNTNIITNDVDIEEKIPLPYKFKKSLSLDSYNIPAPYKLVKIKSFDNINLKIQELNDTNFFEQKLIKINNKINNKIKKNNDVINKKNNDVINKKNNDLIDNIKNINDIKNLDKKINEITDYNLIHTPFKTFGEELLNDEINTKFRNKSKGANCINEYQIIIKKLKENFRKLVMNDVKEKPNLSKILLDTEIPENIKLKIINKYIKYSTEDEMFSENAEKYKIEINNLIKLKKIKNTNDYDDIWCQIENKIMPSNLKDILENMYYRIISGDESKLTNHIHNILKLPYHKIPNTLDNIAVVTTSYEQQVDFIKSIYKKLDDNLFGLNEVKDSIISYICQKINNPAISNSKYLCLCGPAGVGKTSIVHAISEALQIPYSYISLANIDNSSTLIGHDYTYEGSTYGCIADAIIKNGCSNGILLFDELDKCKEKIHNTLLGIFDPLQNSKFRDTYFSNFYIDLSQNMMIICLNDLDKINPILKDRLHIVNIPGYNNNEKKIIINKYILPKLVDQYKVDIEIDPQVIDNIIFNTSQHKGIRQLIMYLTKIYELVVLDKYTHKFNFGKKFTLHNMIYIKINNDKVDNPMYI